MGKQFRGHVASAVALVLTFTTVANGQQTLPEPTDVAEAAVVGDFAQRLGQGIPTLKELDALLVRLTRPTPWRGIVQSLRAMQLLDEDRLPEAKAAAEESCRLTPGNAMTRISATYVLTFTGSPQAAADAWLEASMIDPSAARQTESYWLDAMLGRLREAGDNRRADQVSVRMDEIGMTTTLLEARSSAAGKRLEAAFAKGGSDAARPMLSAVESPGDVLRIYLDRRYASLWPAIDEWAGPDFVALHKLYLAELRREWRTDSGPEAAVSYARALNSARAYPDTIALFLPELSPDKTREYRPGTEFLAPAVASALTMSGRRSEAETMLARVESSLPREIEGMRLNLSASLISQAYRAQDWPQVARRAEEWMVVARKQGPTINAGAIQNVAALQVCALEKLGRTAQAKSIAAGVIAASRFQPYPALAIHSCADDLVAARRLVLGALANPDQRSLVLGYLQPSTPDPNSPPQVARDRAFMDRIRADPQVRAAAAKVGRILPKPVLESLPPNFDPRDPGPVPKPSPDAI